MRLTDADALKQTFCAECVRTQCENCSIDYRFNHASTVDVVEVVAKNETATAETVYNRYTDTAGNYHWTGAYSGEHIVRMDSGEKTARYINAKENSMFVGDKTYKELPTVDVVEVVRCKDCVCCDRDNGSPWCGLIGLHIDDDHYCAWGERKDEEDIASRT